MVGPWWQAGTRPITHEEQREGEWPPLSTPYSVSTRGFAVVNTHCCANRPRPGGKFWVKTSIYPIEEDMCMGNGSANTSVCGEAFQRGTVGSCGPLGCVPSPAGVGTIERGRLVAFPLMSLGCLYLRQSRRLASGWICSESVSRIFPWVLNAESVHVTDCSASWLAKESLDFLCQVMVGRFSYS